MGKTPIPFRGFDEHAELRIYYHGILPHWRQRGCTYFVTFRLADSLPKRVVEELEYERTLWLRARGVNPAAANWKQQFARLPANERRQYERFAGQRLNKSLDECHGSCVLRNPDIGQKVADALQHFDSERVRTGDFVVMPNHVHALLTPIEPYELEDILQSIKSHTAREINRELKGGGRLWQRESYDHIVRDMEQLQAYQEYIAANPSKAKLHAGEYILSQDQYQEASS